MKPDIEKTRAYYCNLGPENICGCAYCQNYCARVKVAYPEVALYLDSLGVDIEKPFETSPLEPDENGYLEYCVCQYIVFGSCDAEKMWTSTPSLWMMDTVRLFMRWSCDGTA